jgi:plastocyanin
MTALMLGASVSAHAATIASAKVGDTIEWINKNIFVHTATARNGDWDVTMPPKVLKKAGLIDYYCRFHPNMKATLGVAP